MNILQPINANDFETVSLAYPFNDFINESRMKFLEKAKNFSEVKFYNDNNNVIAGCYVGTYYDEVIGCYSPTLFVDINDIKFRIEDENLNSIRVLKSVYDYVLNS